MRTLRLNLSLAFTGLAGLLACTGPYDPAGLSTTLAEAQCQFAFDCCSAAERTEYNFTSVGTATYSNKDECLDEVSRTLRASLNVLAEAQAQGRIEWDAAAAEECYNASKTAANECNAKDYYEVSCDISRYISGKVAAGDACYNSFECAEDGAVCETNTSDDEETSLVTLVGKCVAPLKKGDDCSGGEISCAPNLYCNVSDEICTAYLTIGSDCSEGYCNSNEGYCSLEGDNFKCVAFKAVGEQCESAIECRSYECDSTSNTCVSDAPAVVEAEIVYEMCTGEII